MQKAAQSKTSVVRSQPGPQQQAEFDHYAGSYESLHAANIGISGEEPVYFAEYKVREGARCLGDTAVQRIADFGCGIGGSIPFFRKYFPKSHLLGLDVSQESLREAERRHGSDAEFRHLDGGAVPLSGASCDLAFAACVFHHIPPAEHDKALRQLCESLTADGHFFLFEHNPLNPLTLHAVNTCPFDADAILIRGAEMARRVKAAGFTQVRLRYCTFFPKALSILRPLEPRLAWLPLGAQYYVWARP